MIDATIVNIFDMLHIRHEIRRLMPRHTIAVISMFSACLRPPADALHARVVSCTSAVTTVASFRHTTLSLRRYAMD